MKIEFDQGFSFGKGAFETIKVVDNRPLFLQAHLSRLASSLDFFGIEQELDQDRIFDYINQVDGDNFALKLMVSDDNFILTHRPDPYQDNQGKFHLTISNVQRNTTSKLIYHKSLAYYENILEDHLAKDQGFDSALFVNQAGQLAETAFANIFLVKDGKVYTPALSSGLLAGTMRAYLLENYAIEEAVIPAQDLASFDECFISNALMGVRNVAVIDDYTYPNDQVSQAIQTDLAKFGFR